MDKNIVIAIFVLSSFTIAIITSFLFSFISQTTVDKTNPSSKIIPSPKQLVGKTEDAKDDVQLLRLYKTAILPEIHNYHDIISTEVHRIDNNKLLFTIYLDGNPNNNEKFETVYIWTLSYIDSIDNRNQIYTIIIPNFANDSDFNNKGWYLAVFNNTNNQYSLPLSKIKDMPESKVEVFLDSSFIGNIFSFNYSTAVMVRVNDSFLAKPPDYLLDSSPDNNFFWLKWFE